MVNLLRTGKNAVMLFSGTATRMVATFLFVIFSANTLGVTGFGKYSLVVHYFELFVSLTATATAILLIREIAGRKQDRDQLITAAAMLTTCLAMLTPILLIPLSLAFGYSLDTVQAIGIACLGLIPAGIAMVFEAVFVAKERAEFVTVGVAIECVFRVGLSVLVLLLGYGIVELSLVLVFSRLVLAIVYFFLLLKVINYRVTIDWQTIFRFASQWRVFAAENWMATIYTNLDIIVLSSIVGETAVGLYSAAWRYVRLGTVAAKSFTTAFFPTLTRIHVEATQSFRPVLCHTFRVMCLVALPVISLVSVMPERVVELLFKEEYAGSAQILQILIWVLLLEFINPFLSHVLFSQGRQRYSMVVAGIGLISNLVLMYVLVHRFGAQGAAMACVTTGLIALSSYLYFVADFSTVAGMVGELVRILLAALSMGIVIHFLQHQSWLLIVPVSILIYGIGLLLVQAIRVSDLQFIRQSFSRRALAS
jgi:O-antigen/teichoic acid export membrane protein